MKTKHSVEFADCPGCGLDFQTSPIACAAPEMCEDDKGVAYCKPACLPYSEFVAVAS